MHIEEEILKHLRAQEEDRQRQVKLRAESLDRYIQASSEQFNETVELLEEAYEERDSYKRKYWLAVVALILNVLVTLHTFYGV